MIHELFSALTGPTMRQHVAEQYRAIVDETRTARRNARERIRQLSRGRQAEPLGFLFYQTTKVGGWTMPRQTAREIGLPTEANYLLGLASAFVYLGMRRTVELARAAGIPPLTVAKWAVAASRYIRREESQRIGRSPRHNAWSIAP